MKWIYVEIQHLSAEPLCLQQQQTVNSYSAHLPIFLFSKSSREGRAACPFTTGDYNFPLSFRKCFRQVREVRVNVYLSI